MEFTQKQQSRINYFRRSVRLDSAATQNDSAYVFSDDDLWGILEVSAPIHLGKTIEETPDNEFYYVLLLAKREIYYRLATTTAPFYPLSAEGAKLDKNVRFDHYIKLVETVTKEYERLYDQKYGDDNNFGDETGTGGVVTTYQSIVRGHHYNKRYAMLAELEPLELTVSGITETTANLDWNRFNSSYGSDFLNYEVFVHDDLILDEYSPNPTDKLAVENPLYMIGDIRKTKIRITDLEKGKSYYVLVRANSRAGITAYAQIQFSTISEEKKDAEILVGGD